MSMLISIYKENALSKIKKISVILCVSGWLFLTGSNFPYVLGLKARTWFMSSRT